MSRRGFRKTIIETADAVTPGFARRFIGSSRLLRPMRDLLLRPGGQDVLADGRVRFENLEFLFHAPVRTYIRAERSGIEARLCRLIMGSVQPGFVCLDIGANCGFITIVMALSTGETGKVVSFEPDPFYFNILKKNVDVNNLRNRVAVNGFAMGLTNCKKAEITGIGRVSQRTVDSIMEENSLRHISLIKIDVDGSDYDVLLGARETIRRCRPLIIVEMSRQKELIYDFLKSSGYPHIVDMNCSPVVTGNWPPNIIASQHKPDIPARGSFGS